MDVHLRDLRYFMAVAEELHFTQAAERLFLSQPALSKQIRQLELQLGAPLFERHPRGVTLTAAGTALLPVARGLVDRWADAQREVGEASQVLRIGMSTSIGRGLLPRATRRFAVHRPGWPLDLHQVGWEDPSVGLADRSCDVALGWAPLPDESAFHSRVLGREPIRVALPEGHRLARRRRIPFADLLDEPFLALPKSAGPLRDFWLAADQRAGRPIRIGAEVRTADETFEAIENGLGVVLLAAGNASLYRRPGVVTRLVVGSPEAQLVVAWRADDARPVVLEFVEALATR
ncbi:MAG: LysR family transcriptional regulator [Candidatus Limnocylindria bacterium]